MKIELTFANIAADCAVIKQKIDGLRDLVSAVQNENADNIGDWLWRAGNAIEYAQLEAEGVSQQQQAELRKDYGD